MGRHLFIMSLVLGLIVGLMPASAAPLHQAAKTGELEEAERLILGGADLEELDVDGETPLTAAALAGQTAAMKLLVARGADIKRQNRGGFTALHAAAYKGYIQIVDFALDQGAGIDDQDNKAGITALHAAAERDYLDIIKLLIERGARIDLEELHGWTPIDRATLKSHGQTVRLLMDYGAVCPSSRKIGEMFHNYCMNPGG